VGPAAVGQSNDREEVPELAVGGLEEGLFEALGHGVGQSDADHHASMEEVVGSPPTNRKASAGLLSQEPAGLVTGGLLPSSNGESGNGIADPPGKRIKLGRQPATMGQLPPAS
jgi:hypothetical protein